MIERRGLGRVFFSPAAQARYPPSGLRLANAGFVVAGECRLRVGV